MEVRQYQAIVEWSKKQITDEQLKPGDKFFTEHELMVIFGVSRHTVRNALGQLEYENILERRRGSGSYVSAAAGHHNRPAKSMMIGVISTYIDGYIFSNTLRGIEDTLKQHGYSMLLSSSSNKASQEYRAISSMMDKGVDGLIIEPAKNFLFNPYKDAYLELQKQRIPIVFIDAYHRDMPFPHISLNDNAAGRLAAEHLMKAGHRRIAGLFMSDILQGHRRFEGYTAALCGAGLEYSEQNIIWYTEEDVPVITADAARLIDRIGDCTGLVCFNDLHAVNVVKTLSESGIRIPEDLSVVSVDNSDLAEHCKVPLTSVVHPKEELGAAAADHIVRLIKDPRFDASFEFEPRLVERQSVMRLV